jgi:hypothetical protein
MANSKGKARDTREKVMSKAREAEDTVREYTEDSVDISRELTRQARDSYLSSLKLGISLWENNLKMMNNFIGQWLSVNQELYTSFVDTVIPRSGNAYFGKDLIEKAFSLQREYIDRIRDVSESEMEQAERQLKENL